MAEKQNPYSVLGVDPTATQDEIKKAFRRLAKTVHPDVNKAPDAEEKFDIVREAYNLLSDPDARAAYDENVRTGGRAQYNFGFQDVFDMFFAKPPMAQQPINGENLRATVEFTVYEALSEAEKPVYVRRKRLCPDCHGTRIRDSREKCQGCGGKGSIPKVVPTPFGRIEIAQPCKMCNGYGKKEAVPCTTCEESGLVPDDARVAVQIPKFATDGYTLRKPGKGQPGRDGGLDGDLLVTFKHQPSDRFKLENQIDVIARRMLSLEEALVGGEVDVMFPDGSTQMVKVGHGTGSGDRVTFADQGLFDSENGGRGMFYIEFSVNIPRDVSPDKARKIAKILSE